MPEFVPPPQNTLMSKPDLFAEMDAIADALRENDPTLRESLHDEWQLEFRQLQRRRMA